MAPVVVGLQWCEDVVALAYVYFAYGALPSVAAFFYGVNPVVIGLIAGAAYSMARGALWAGESHLTFSVGDHDWAVDYRLLAMLAVGLYEWRWVRANVWRVPAAGATVALAGVGYALRDRLLGRLGVPSVAGGALALLTGNVWVTLVVFMVYAGAFIFGGGLLGASAYLLV